MKLDRAPFQIAPGRTPGDVAIDFVAAFEAADVYADKVSEVFAALAHCTGLDPANPLLVAGQRIAAHIDAGGAGGHRHAYHHRRHLCEVMMGSHYLALRNALPAVAIAEVVLAALIHDYSHDGKPNGRVAFRLERQSVRLSAPLLVIAGVPAWQRLRIAALILSTDVANGHVIALDYWRSRRASPEGAGHAGSAAAHAPVGALEAARLAEAPELIVLRTDPQVALQALILCEADVLPSVGLTVEHAVRLQRDLSAEWDLSLGTRDKLDFVDEWYRRCEAAAFFKPNAVRLRDAMFAALPDESTNREDHVG